VSGVGCTVQAPQSAMPQPNFVPVSTAYPIGRADAAGAACYDERVVSVCSS
jgi:hypothetical protein